jgi:hypothetical protein
VKNLVIGLVLGAFTSVCAQAALTRHYAATTQEDVQKCISEVQSNIEKAEVSFKFNDDGIDFDQATCWPDGIEITK